MFVPRKLRHRPWPIHVTLQELGADGEIVEKTHPFIGHFRPFSEEEYKALVDELNGVLPVAEAAEGADAAPAEPVKTPADMPLADVLKRNARLFGSLLAGWDQVKDEDGNAIPFSTDALTALVTGPDGLAISAGLNVALMEIRFGKAGAKNSQTSAKPGPGLVEGTVATNLPTT